MAIIFIDGENFRKHVQSIFWVQKKDSVWHSYDFRGLFDKVLQGIKVERAIFYFAKLSEHPQTKEKSKDLIEERRLLKNHLEQQGFEVVVAGRVRGHMELVKGIMGKQKEVLTFKEKGVDVKIAVDLVSMSCDKLLEEAIIASSDSDLQPAITEAKKRGTKLVYLGFENAPNREYL